MIEVHNLTKRKVDMSLLRQVAKKVLQGERKQGELSIAIISEKESQKLNKRYRGENHPTNVLSFSGGNLALGEVFLCPSVVYKEAKKYGMIQQTALAYMLIHGILHLVGYEHEKNAKRMGARERHYLSLFK